MSILTSPGTRGEACPLLGTEILSPVIRRIFLFAGALRIRKRNRRKQRVMWPRLGRTRALPLSEPNRGALSRIYFFQMVFNLK
jgi:hypothetical protein